MPAHILDDVKLTFNVEDISSYGMGGCFLPTSTLANGCRRTSICHGPGKTDSDAHDFDVAHGHGSTPRPSLIHSLGSGGRSADGCERSPSASDLTIFLTRPCASSSRLARSPL